MSLSLTTYTGEMATEAISAADAPSRLPSPSTTYRGLYTYPFDQDPEYLSGLSAILGHPDTPPTQEELTSNPELILQARCFYFARRNHLPPIDPVDYQRWLSENSSSIATATDTAGERQDGISKGSQPSAATAEQPIPTNTVTSGSAEPQQPPPYPTSFAAIVDLITRNVPVPGIEDIPDTVLEHGSSKVDHMPRRRKPWESASDNALPIMSVVEDGAVGGATAGSETSPPDDAAAADDVVTGGTQSGAAAGKEVEEEKASVNGHLVTGEGVVKILQEGAIPDSGLLAKD